jgi:hypothetical protein
MDLKFRELNNSSTVDRSKWKDAERKFIIRNTIPHKNFLPNSLSTALVSL